MRVVLFLVGVLLSLRLSAVPQPVNIDTLASGLSSPWTVVTLPDGRYLITERTGSLVTLHADGSVHRQQLNLPQLYVAGQGGLLDIALTQDFRLSNKLLLTYVSGSADANTLVVASATLQENGELTTPETVFEVTPARATPVHYGGRLAVLNDGTWLVTSGDGFDYREQAQELSSQMGKILRFREDGEAPADNPFSEAPYVYSLGHRNPQALLVSTQRGEIISHEHGPDGGDEINLIRAGNNYGWPVVTDGLDYSGAKISPFSEYAGMTPPAVNWTPSIAPSGMALYQAERFPELTGKLLVSTLKKQRLLAVDLMTSPPKQMYLFEDIHQRIRDVAVDNNGDILVLTDGKEATLLRVTPAR
ncbi:PQQ-dependent sugar dehydrogenase [Alteromonas halophila]|uniref:Glucose/Sorbosone dehydrogenase domain-containing protein n=1 Tax=Alteromonas halophila TaxID=516698 RepID=A0A918JI70_9ALTE|nr:PQQ-dependent sugar dehydrogenase [Alteromonas halophila]GGW80692.1 hypothetical protein GCM10007391_12050 [Alteromonas halophila]